MLKTTAMADGENVPGQSAGRPHQASQALPQGTDPVGTLWVDMGRFLQWSGPFSGIQRTLAHLLEVWFQESGLRLRLCCFDPQERTYREVPRQVVSDLLARHRDGSFARPGGQPPDRSFRQTVRRAARLVLRFLPAKMGDLCRRGGLFLWRLTRALARPVVRLGRRLLPRTVAPPCAFAPQDVLFIAANSWEDLDSCTALAQARRQTGLRVAPLIYDVIPARLPQFVPPILNYLFEAWLKKVLNLSDLVLTISEHSRGDLAEAAAELDVRVPPVAVLRLGDELGQPCRPVRPHNLPDWLDGPFVLSVGSLGVRKNQWLLYQLWRRLAQRHREVPPLLLVGQPSWLANELIYQIEHDPLVRQRVVLLNDVSDPELRWLYGRCLFTMYPSQYEGWGLPVAESLAHGKYCICSNASSLPEIAGDLVDYHDPLDFPGCLALVERALFQPGFLEQAEQRIRAGFRITPWASCATRVLEALQTGLRVSLRAGPADVPAAA